jgi:hypothetical protein
MEGVKVTMEKAAKRKSKPEVLMMRVIKGGLEPADEYTRFRLRERKYNLNDLVSITIKKLNNPKFNRLVHYIGVLCTENIDEFQGMDAHQVLKRLQIEGNIHCDAIGVAIPGIGITEYRYPLSLSFEDLDDGGRHEVALKFCRLISSRYWPNLTPEAIETMAESFINEF